LRIHLGSAEQSAQTK